MATAGERRTVTARRMALALVCALAPAPALASVEAPRGAGSVVWEEQAAGGHGIAIDHAAASPSTDALEQEIAALGENDSYATAEPGPLDALMRAVGRLPEPATWGLMILGFGGIGGAMRRRMRRSDADFTARVRRIADGEDPPRG